MAPSGATRGKGTAFDSPDGSISLAVAENQISADMAAQKMSSLLRFTLCFSLYAAGLTGAQREPRWAKKLSFLSSWTVSWSCSRLGGSQSLPVAV